MSLTKTRALFIYPSFDNSSFWNYTASCNLIGAKYPAPPLGLITFAAMLPQEWDMRLIDRNVESLSDQDVEWADVIFVGGMLPQRLDLLEIIKIAKDAGVPIVIGGPAMTSEPELYADADIRIIGEAEGAVNAFIEAWERGERKGVFRAPLHSVDVTKTPLPRYDLITFSNYLMVNVQFSRGCPFLCEFCDIIELFGRKPRTKDTDQILAELQAIYDQGHRGHIDFVDDNLIGNKKAVKAFLPHLVEWQKARNYPFIFSTEASLNLADDPEFMGLMRDAGFFAVFIGIESPDPDVLAATQKKQNTKRDIARCVNDVQAYGMFVVAGFIVGFDNEGDYVDQGLIELVEEASVPIAMVGMLYALPNTQLTRRLHKEGRLHDISNNDVADMDQCTAGLNFTTLRPRVDIMRDYLNVVEHLYERKNFFARVRRTVELLDVSGVAANVFTAAFRHDATMFIKLLWNATFKSKELRTELWKLTFFVLRKKPRALKQALLMGAIYEHLGPFSRHVSDRLSARIDEISADPNYEDSFVMVPADQPMGIDTQGQQNTVMPSGHMTAAE
ncbi:MAG: B12-binding domain-containing radical SAM protein [Pseudomonadota bacterium]